MNRLTLKSWIPKRHWGPRYFQARLSLRWWQMRNGGAPWLAPDAVATLEARLGSQDTVVELGAGRSTLWFAQRVGRLISFEHDHGWYDQVVGDIADRSLSNVELVHAPSDRDAYLEALGTYAPGTADVVLVDGEWRAESALWAVDHLRPTGLLIVDNAERYLPSDSLGPESIGPDALPSSAEWATFWERVLDHRKVWFDCGVFSTLFIFT